VVERLAVVGEPPAPVPRRHGLMTGRGSVQDAEAPVPEDDAADGLDPLVVRAAVVQRRHHPLDGLLRGRPPGRHHRPGDPAHGSVSLVGDGERGHRSAQCHGRRPDLTKASVEACGHRAGARPLAVRCHD
jgi:hypothetical protein